MPSIDTSSHTTPCSDNSDISTPCSGEGCAFPDCSICLDAITSAATHCKTNPCLHDWHVECIEQWLQRRHICPLCKMQVTSLLTHIESDDSFQEKPIPALIPSSTLEDIRYPSGWLLRRRQTSSVFGHRRQRPQNHGGNTHVSSRYHLRLQSRVHTALVSNDVRPSRSEQGPSEAAHQTIVRWRRSVYNRNLWAIQESTRPAGMPSNVGDANVRRRRLELWVERELEALVSIGTQQSSHDITILKAFVMGLAQQNLVDRRGGLEVPRPQLQDALEPFLGVHAAHFWHELLCFAKSPYSLMTYDRLVRYPVHQEQNEHPSRRRRREDGGGSRTEGVDVPAPKRRRTDSPDTTRWPQMID